MREGDCYARLAVEMGDITMNIAIPPQYNVPLKALHSILEKQNEMSIK